MRGSSCDTPGVMRWCVLLLVLGCGEPHPADIVFPAVTIDADSDVRGVLDLPSLITTTRMGVDAFLGRRIVDHEGREYVVDAVREVDPPGMFSDPAGTKRFQVELSLRRGRKLKPAEAVALIAETIRANPSYLDLTEEGRAAVAAELGRKSSVAEVARTLVADYDRGRVIADSIARENRRVEGLAERGE